PKELRDELGITDSVEIEKKGDKIMIVRAKTLRERMEEIHASFTPEMMARIKKNAGKTVNQLREEMEKTPEGRAYIKEFYGA
ncbi:AbrB/MazE/SpoVT family DNA-binding domain-containing protein, partial [Candidatus Saccharibacteria bacterium]|nr:AbrB/MazE/SpoVT family DNA-binding domain-containing protein [Candidatus Saccharibacteria bacterium]